MPYLPQSTRKNYSLTNEQKQDARDAIRALEGHHMTLLECVKSFLALGGKSTRPTDSIPIEDATDAFLRKCLIRKLRPTSISFYRQFLSNFCDQFPNAHLDEVTRESLMSWLSPMSPASASARVRSIRALYNHGRHQLPPWCSTNPAENLPLSVPMRDRKIEFLTVAQAERIMLQSPREYTAALALMLFAGIRPEEIRGTDKPALTWQNIDLRERSITIPANVSKTRTARVIQNGCPRNLWKWINASPHKTGDVSPIHYATLRTIAQRAACLHGEQWPHDATRHSFATYYVAAFGDIAAAVEITGHGESLSTFKRHYHGAAKKEDALKYFAISPETPKSKSR